MLSIFDFELFNLQNKEEFFYGNTHLTIQNIKSSPKKVELYLNYLYLNLRDKIIYFVRIVEN